MQPFEFTLGGKKYELSLAQVEERLLDIPPKSLDRYSVEVNGKFYPPKQVLGLALDIPLVSFTTMDANRVLARCGFEVKELSRNSAPVAKPRLESEQLFERYLNAARLTEHSFESGFDESKSRPDYTLEFQGSRILFEVKEFRPSREDFNLGSGAYDPYGPIREKINAARKKFQDLKNHVCCLVLYNCGKPLIHLEWEFVYAAMLGNLAFQVPIDLKRGQMVGEPSRTFAGGGKMIRYKGGTPIAPQNTTLSSVIVLQQLDIGKRRFKMERSRRRQELGRELTLDESLDMLDKARGTERDWSLTQLRVVVHENPYARKPLTREIFCGLYDERFGLVNDQIRRVFVGAGLCRIEEEERSIEYAALPSGGKVAR